MILTQRQLDVLNHVVVDGQAWADAATEEAMIAKVTRWASSYDAAVLKGNYRNRAQRDVDEASDLLNLWASDVATARTKRIQELKSHICLQYQVHIDPHYLKQNRREQRGGTPYTIPASIETFEDGLEALTYKDDIAALNTVKEIQDYNINLPALPEE